MWTRCMMVGALLLVAALVIPATGQQIGSFGQNTGSFLNGARKPITFKPINLPKATQPLNLPKTATTPNTKIFDLGRVYPKISLGNWPLRLPGASAPAPSIGVAPK